MNACLWKTGLHEGKHREQADRNDDGVYSNRGDFPIFCYQTWEDKREYDASSIGPYALL